MKKYICLFLTLWGLLPGFAQQTDTVVLNLSEAITHEPKVIMLSEIASDIHFISLETTDDFSCAMNIASSIPEMIFWYMTGR